MKKNEVLSKAKINGWKIATGVLVISFLFYLGIQILGTQLGEDKPKQEQAKPSPSQPKQEKTKLPPCQPPLIYATARETSEQFSKISNDIRDKTPEEVTRILGSPIYTEAKPNKPTKYYYWKHYPQGKYEFILTYPEGKVNSVTSKLPKNKALYQA